MTVEETEEWLRDASSLHRQVLHRLHREPAPTIELARDLDAEVWDVACCLQDLQDQYLVGERAAADPRYKREYVVTPYGERCWQQAEETVTDQVAETADAPPTSQNAGIDASS